MPVSAEVARSKSALIHEHYPSQNGHPWFDEEAFLGLLRVRGAQCNARYAEGFVVAKTVIEIGDRLVRVLLTGHQGYLGTVMAPVLTAAGHDVVGLDTGWFADNVLGPVPADPPTLTRDLREVTVADLEGFDAVIHLAALCNDPLGSLAPEITYDINHHASTRLARLAKEAGVGRFLYSSTCSVYGAAGSGLVAEDAELAPVHAVRGEQGARRGRPAGARPTTSFTTVSLRNATAFGFSPRLRADIVLNNLVGYALLTGEVLVKSDGTPWRPLVHAADIAEVVRGSARGPGRSPYRARRSTSATSATTSPWPRSPRPWRR